MSLQSTSFTLSIEGVASAFMTPFQKLYWYSQNNVRKIWAGFTDLNTLNEELRLTREKLQNYERTAEDLTEIKSENNIDRLTSAANPRSFERVPAGVDFDFEMMVDLYNVDDADMQKKLLDIVKQGMKLVELDYIGGHGSRGYGQVKFHEIKIKVKTAESYKEGKDWDENHQFEVNFDDFKI